MADQKLYDMVVTVGSYVDKNGAEKKQYKQIGSVYQGKTGMYAVMDKFFNPAAVQSDRNTFFASFYEPKDNNQQRPQQRPELQFKAQDFNDDIPW